MTVQIQILLLLRQLQEELGMAIVFVTHDVGVAAEISDRIAVMYAGRFVEAGAARDVLHRPQHPYTEGLLSSTVHGAMRGRTLETIPGNPPNLAELPLRAALPLRHPRLHRGRPAGGASGCRGDGKVHPRDRGGGGVASALTRRTVMERKTDFATFATLMGQSGLNLTEAQLLGVFEGYVGLLGMLDRVNTPLPREIEPALTFDPVNV